jgi:fibronectin-binding autotransporter adhesin
MNAKMSWSAGSIAAIVVLGALSIGYPAAAATFTFDASGTGALTDGSGTWNTTSANWWSGASPDVVWPNNTSSIALFGTGSGTAGTVTVLSVSANGLTFNAPGSGAYSLSGGTITLGGTTPTITTNATNAAIGSVIAGTSGLMTAGPGILTLVGSNTFTGNTAITGGTLAIGGAGLLGSGNYAGAISNSGALAVNTSVSQSFGGVISGTGALYQLGSGITTLSGSNTYTGGTTISAGTLAIGGGGVLGGGNYSPAITDAGSLVVNTASSQTFGGVISGAGNLYQNGSGVTTLTGSNSYSGGTTVGAGTLAIGGGGVLGGGNYSPAITDAGSLVVNTASGQTFGGVIAGAGNLYQNGSGVTTLTNSNTFTGTTLVSNGTLVLGNAAALQGSTFNANGSGVLNVGSLSSVTFGGLTGSASLALGGGSVSLTVGGNAASTTYSGNFGFTSPAALTKIGAGTLMLSGTNNAIPGGIFVNGGTLLATNTGAAPGWSTGQLAVATSANFAVSAGATGEWSTANIGTLLGTNAFGAGSNIGVNVDSGMTFAYGTDFGTNQVAKGLLKAGPGQLTLTTPNSYTGVTTISGGTLQLGTGVSGQDASLASQSIVDAGALSYNLFGAQTYSGAISGAGSVTKGGANQLTFAGSNTYTGTTNVNGGTLNYIGGASSSGNATMNLGTAGNSVLNIATTGAITFNSTNIGMSSGFSAVVNQSAGLFDAETNGGYVAIGGVGGYGAINLTGGTLETTASSGFRIGDGGPGIFTQTGGSLSSSRYFVVGANSGSGVNLGVANMLGGTATIGSGFYVIVGNTSGAVGTVNIGTESGGNALFTALSTSGVQVGQTSGAKGTLNLNSGTLATSGAILTTAGGTGTINLNGGVLTPASAGVTLINTTPTSVNVYNGGAVVNTAGFNATIAAPLLATVGNGIYASGGSIAVTGGNGGSGYLGAPYVTVADSTGAGSGATAIAAITGGSISSVTLTSPGQNYNAGDVLVFSFSGGGATSPATTYSYTLQPSDLAANGLGGLTKGGSGTLTLTANNTYTGATAISGGVLAVSGTGTLGASTSSLMLRGGRLDLGATTQSVGAVSITAAASDGGNTIQNGSLSGASYVASNASGNAVVTANLLGSAGMTMSGAGTLTLAGSNSYTGGTFLNGGELAVASSAALGSATTISFGGGALQFTASNTQDYSGQFSIAPNQAYSIDTNGQSVTLAGNLTSSGGSLNKLGAGTLNLTGINTYSGATTVTGGKLYLDGSTSPTGAVRVLAGATLGGTGSTGNTTVLNGGILEAGQGGVGTLTLNSLTFGANPGDTASINFFNLAAAPTTLQVNGNITVLGGSGTVTINASPNPPTGTYAVIAPPAGTYPLIGYTGTLTGSNALAASVAGLGARSTATLVNAPGEVELQLQIVSPVWTGAVSSAWNTSGVQNWVLNTNGVNGAATNYVQGDSVVFDDTPGFNSVVAISGTNVMPSSVQFNNNAFAYTLQGTAGIAGSASLVVNGGGGVMFASSNAYTGGTFINAGTVTAANANAFPSGPGAGNVVISTTSSNASLDLNGTPLVNINGLSGGGGSFAAQLINSATGTLATLNLGNGNASATFAGVIADNNGTGGQLALTKSGSGTQTLTAANTFSGPTNVNGGTLALGNSLAAQNSTVGIVSSSSVTFVGGITAATFGNLQGSGNLPLVNSSGAGVALTVGNNSSSTTYSGGLSGAGSLTTIGSGSITLTGPSTFTGGTYINSGTVTYAGSASSSGAGMLQIAAAASGAQGVLNITTTGRLTFDGGNFLIGSLDNSAGAINQSAGVVSLGSANNYYLQIGGGNASDASQPSYGSYNLSGGTLQASTFPSGIRVGTGGMGSFVQTGGAVICPRYFVVGGNGGGYNNGVATFLGGIDSVGTGGYYTIVGNLSGSVGVMNIGTEAGGTAAFSCLNGGGVQLGQVAGATGTLNLNSGLLTLGGPIQTPPAGAAIGIVNLNGGTLQAGASGVTLINTSNTSVNVYNGGAIIDTQGNTASVTANLLAPSGSGIYIAGELALTASNGGSGYIGAPLVTVAGGSGTGATAVANVVNGVVTGVTLTSPGQGYLPGDQLTFSFNGGGSSVSATPLNYTLQAGNVAANTTGGLTKTGSGTLIVSGANTYQGNTSIVAGTLKAASAGALGVGNVVISSTAAILDLDGTPIVAANLLSGGGSIATGQVINSVASSVANLNLGNGAGGSSTYSGLIADNNGSGGQVALTISGGTQVLAAANTFTGATALNGGLLVLTNGLALQKSTLDVETGAVGFLGISAGTLGGLQGTGNLSLVNIAGQNLTLAIGNNATNTTFSGVMTGGGSLNKIGASSLTLAGSNNYSGLTTVSSGNLYVDGSISTAGSVQVAAGATLGGMGSAGNVTVLSGGILEAGHAGTGTLTLNSLRLGANSGDTATINYPNLTTAPATLLQVNGNITTLGGSGSVTIDIPSNPGSGTYPLIDYTGSLNSFSALKVFVPGLGARSFAKLLNPPGQVELQLQVAYPIWTGAVSTAWNTSNVQNWVLNNDGPATNYIQGDSVVFDDTPGSNSVVTVSGTNVLPSSVQFNNNAYAYTLQGTAGIAGSTSVTINGVGGVTFANSNSYTGGTFINAGTVTAASAAAFPSGPGTGNVVISTTSNNAALDLHGTPMVNINGLAGGGESSNAQVFNSGAGTSTLNMGNGSGVATFAGVIADNNGTGGQVALTLSGGTETLTAANTFSGLTTVNGGALILTNGLALQNSTLIVSASGSAAFQGVTAVMLGGVQAANLSFPVPVNLTVGANSVNSFFAGGLSGNSSLTTVGSGSLTMSGQNNYSGPTTVNGGSLIFTGTNSLGAVNVNNGGLTFTGPATITGATTVNGGTLTFSDSSSNSGNAPLVVGSTVTGVMNLSSGGTLAYSSVNIGNTTGASGAINLAAGTFNAFNTSNDVYLGVGVNGGYGSLNITGGTLNTNDASGMRVGEQGLGSYTQSGGLLQTTRYFVVGFQAGGTGVATFTGGAAAIGGGYRTIVGNNGGNSVGTLNIGTEAGGNGVFGSTQIEMNNNASSYATININSGTLAINGGGNGNANVGIYMTNGYSGIVNFNGGRLQANANNFNLIDNTPTSVNIYNGGAIFDTNGNTAKVSAVLQAPSFNGVTGSDGIYIAGGTLVVTATDGGSGYIGAPLVSVTDTTGFGSGATAIANVVNGVVMGVTLTNPGVGYSPGDQLTFNFSGGGATNPATLNYTLQAGDVAANTTGGVTKVGAGLLVLSGSNNYEGNTTVTAGTLQLGNLSALGAGGLVVNGGATVDLAGYSPTVNGLSGNGTVTNSGSAVTLTVSPSSTTSFSGTLQDGAAVGGLALLLDGPGKLVLSGTNTYTGGTIVEAGTLIAASPTALAAGSSLTVGQGAPALFAVATAAPGQAAASAEVAAVPEPGTLALLATGLVAGLGVWRGRRRGVRSQKT